MKRLQLSGTEARAIKGLLAEVQTEYNSAEDAAFLKDAPVIAHEMPLRVRAFLSDFKQLEPLSGACLITGYSVDDNEIGPTPFHWRDRAPVSSTKKEEMLFILFGSFLGDTIGWATQQNGNIIHEVLPIKDDENEQISTGSRQIIWWHNEDAFHPYRGDYVALMCLRNPDRVATTLATFDKDQMSKHQLEILFEPRFVIRPDESHSAKNRLPAADQIVEANGELEDAYKNIERMHTAPDKLSVLFGNTESPYLRLDPYFMDPLEDEETQSALNRMMQVIDSCRSEIVLHPGDFLFVDNYRAVHGRKPFKARYDGTDRWLKRMNLTRDLRKSCAARLSSISRIIH